MKNIFTLVACLFTAATLSAQDCGQYVYMQKGKTIESTSFGENGNIIRKSESYVADVSSAGGVTTATINATYRDKTGKTVDKKDITYRCQNGTFSMDMSGSTPKGGGFKINAGNMSYPANMHVGEHFDDFSVDGSMTIGGKTTSLTSKVTDRKVVAEENVTTPAGSWDCFKITYNTTVTIPGMKMGPQTMSSTEWYAANFGVVQVQVMGMTTKITAIR
jgi:hypothetical protein